MLVILISFCRSISSSPMLLTQCMSMMELVHLESTRAVTPAHCTVVSISKCTWRESSHFSHFGFSSVAPIVTFLGISRMVVGSGSSTFLSSVMGSLWVCLCCKIIYFGILLQGQGQEHTHYCYM